MDERTLDALAAATSEAAAFWLDAGPLIEITSVASQVLQEAIETFARHCESLKLNSVRVTRPSSHRI